MYLKSRPNHLNCDDFRYIMNVLDKIWPHRLELLGVLLGEGKEKLGRIAISKQTGLTERRVRTIKSAITKNIASDEKLAVTINTFLKKISIWKSDLDNRKAVAVCSLERSLLEDIIKRVVLLRDLIVIETRLPGELEVIGVRMDDEILIPRLPTEIAEDYQKLLSRTDLPNNCVFTVWSSYPGIIVDASLLTSLVSFCENNVVKSTSPMKRR